MLTDCSGFDEFGLAGGNSRSRILMGDPKTNPSNAQEAIRKEKNLMIDPSI